MLVFNIQENTKIKIIIRTRNMKLDKVVAPLPLLFKYIINNKQIKKCKGQIQCRLTNQSSKTINKVNFNTLMKIWKKR